MSRLGMRAVSDIKRVTVKKAKNILFVISNPDVFQNPGSDTFVIFGEAKIEDMSAANVASAADSLTRAPDLSRARADASAAAAAPAAASSSAAAAGDDEDVDESGLESKDIELVMTQADVSRARAVTALRNNDSDIVNAIMELTI